MAAKAQQVNPDGYVHARDVNEYQRLRDQALMWQRATQEVLDRVGLEPGMSCLDVGAGPGAVMRLMADRVQAQGRVTGLEIDGKLAAQALAELRAQGGAQFNLIEADVLALDTVPGAPFDLTFCRLFLMHMQDPVAAQFEAAGLGVPDGTRAEVKYLPLKDMAAMLIGVYQGLFASAVELGIADPVRAANGLDACLPLWVREGSKDKMIARLKDAPQRDRIKADMADAGADGRYYCLTPILIAAWKRVA